MHTPSSGTPAPPPRSKPKGFASRRAALVAATAVVALGVVAFISVRSTPTTPKSGDARASLVSVLADTPQVDTRQVVLHVDGMYCTSCEHTVTAMLKRTPGVVGATVSVQRAEAVVSYDLARTSPATLVDVIRRLGYTASLPHT